MATASPSLRFQITTAEAARLLGRSPELVRRLVRQGRLVPIGRFGQAHVFDRRAVKRFAKIRRTAGGYRRKKPTG